MGAEELQGYAVLNMEKINTFLKRKDVVFTPQRYLVDVLSGMAQSVFATLIIGLILKTIGEQIAVLTGENGLLTFLVDTGSFAMELKGPAIGVAVALALKAPNLVVFTSAVTGAMGSDIGGEVAALVAAIVGAEAGKLISKETSVDILVTPGVTLMAGSLAAVFAGPLAKSIMTGIGAVIQTGTELQPLLMGIIVSVGVGAVLTSPLSSAAVCIMLELSGLAAGAAVIGCCAQMVGFAATSYRDCGMEGVMAIGLGTTKFQLPNIIKNPWIYLPPTIASAVIGPLGTCVFEMVNTKEGAGMGTCGLAGQIFTFTEMGLNAYTVTAVLLLHFFLPVILSLGGDWILRRMDKIHDGDYALDL